MARVDPQVRALLVERLRGMRAAGELTTEVVRRAAADVGVVERTVWGWLAAGPDGLEDAPREHYVLSEADVAAFAMWDGNVAAVHRELHAARAEGLSLRRLQHAFTAQLSPGQRAGLVEGAEGRRRYEVYLRWDPPGRNAMWEGDHVELPVLVLAPRAQRPAKPWATLFLDGYSRLIVGWAISMRPNTATVLAALRVGIVVDEARGPWCGVPGVLRTDHGLEFTATALRRSCAALGVELVPAPPYTPHLKGKVERVNRTLATEFLAGLPFHTDGPRGVEGRLLDVDGPGEPMGLELFVARFAGWVQAYNTERRHSSLATTPVARWREDATPLRLIEASSLRWMLMADVERTVNRDGVHFGGVRFIAPELNGLVGERLQVRYTPHDLRQIELFQGDHWLATAYPQDTLDAAQRAAVLERRRTDAAEIDRLARRARRRARAQLAPITSPGPTEDTTVITTQDRRPAEQHRDRPVAPPAARVGEPASSRGLSRADAELRRQSRTNLLDLKTDFAFWNPGLADPAPAARAPVELDDLERPSDDEQGGGRTGGGNAGDERGTV